MVTNEFICNLILSATEQLPLSLQRSFDLLRQLEEHVQGPLYPMSNINHLF
jgi:hypothetical protein